MSKIRYRAKWIYGPQCLRKDQIKAECEARTLTEFSYALCAEYGYNVGDNFSFFKFQNEQEVRNCYGDELPEWFDEITAYPVLTFSSPSGTEILCNPTATDIVNMIRSDFYGDYDLHITGI